MRIELLGLAVKPVTRPVSRPDALRHNDRPSGGTGPSRRAMGGASFGSG